MNNENRAKSILDKAIRLQQEHTWAGDSLSRQTRDRIMQSVSSHGASIGPIGSLFVPMWRFAVAGAVPVLLAVVLVSWISVGHRSMGTATFAEVSKVDGQVVFTIENGKREHLIARSLTPDRFDQDSVSSVTEGSYKDSLDSGPDLVFYRID